MENGFRTNGRAKPGKGKQWYHGLNYERLKVLRRQVLDSDAENRTNLKALYSNTERFLLHASDLARSGKKDAARNWVRYFNNSRTLHVLADGGLDVANLRALLHEVSMECHPQDTPEFETDIQAIRFFLEEILLQLRATEAGRDALICSAVPPDNFPQ